MKKLNKSWALLMLVVFAFSSCKKDPVIEDEKPEVINPVKSFVELKVEGTMNGEPLQLNTDFTNINGNRSVLELVNIYLSNMYLLNDGDSTLLKDVELISYTNSKYGFKTEVPKGNYNAFHFGLGVPADMNGMNNPSFDITQYPNEHPLSLYQGTYWTWNTGYRFMMFDGRIDTTSNGTGNFVRTFAYHPGLDSLYRDKTHLFPSDLIVNEGQTKVIKLKFEFNDLMMIGNTPINMVDEFSTHSTSVDIHIAIAMMENFVNKVEISTY